MRIQPNPWIWAACYVIVAWMNLLPPVNGHPSFYSSRLLHDGEQQRVISFGGVTVRETTALVPASHDNATAEEHAPAAAARGMRLVQVTDGRHLVEAIFYADYKLKDCEYVRDKEAVEEFLESLRPDFEAATGLIINNNNHNKNSQEAEQVNGSRVTYDGVINLKLLRHAGDLFPESKRLVDYKWIRNECRSLHRKMKEVMRHAKQHGDAAGSRKKRELLIYPGTNWCGVGSATEGFNDLGWNAAADRCCRQHDHCPFVIESFTKKYNLFNYRFHTLSHCECDERFRTCLKMVDNAPSNLVGKLFFNVVQMKCFVLKSEKTCVKRSWWGRCLKHEKQMQAHERDVLSY